MMLTWTSDLRPLTTPKHMQDHRWRAAWGHTLNCQMPTCRQIIMCYPILTSQVRHKIRQQVLNQTLSLTFVSSYSSITTSSSCTFNGSPLQCTFPAWQGRSSPTSPNTQTQMKCSLLPAWPLPWSSPICNISFNLLHPSKIISTVSCFSQLFQPDPSNITWSLPSHLSVAHRELCTLNDLFTSYFGVTCIQPSAQCKQDCISLITVSTVPFTFQKLNNYLMDPKVPVSQGFNEMRRKEKRGPRKLRLPTAEFNMIFVI